MLGDILFVSLTYSYFVIWNGLLSACKHCRQFMLFTRGQYQSAFFLRGATVLGLPADQPYPDYNESIHSENNWDILCNSF